jgi:hypothetical protein
MKVRMVQPVSGYFYNNPDGARIGDVVDVPDDHGADLIRNQLAEPVKKKEPEERAVPPDESEKAVLTTEQVPKRATKRS